MIHQNLTQRLDNFYERIYFIDDVDFKERVGAKYISLIFCYEVLLKNEFKNKSHVDRTLHQEFMHIGIVNMASIVEAVLFFLIKKTNPNSLDKIFFQKDDKLVLKNEFQLSNGKKLLIQEFESKIKKAQPNFNRILEYCEKEKIFNNTLISDLKDLKDCRNQIHIYDIDKNYIKINKNLCDRFAGSVKDVLIKVEEILNATYATK